jgi:hypothetical protein
MTMSKHPRDAGYSWETQDAQQEPESEVAKDETEYEKKRRRIISETCDKLLSKYRRRAEEAEEKLQTANALNANQQAAIAVQCKQNEAHAKENRDLRGKMHILEDELQKQERISELRRTACIGVHEANAALLAVDVCIDPQ